jgi:hypothetical protein
LDFTGWRFVWHVCVGDGLNVARLGRRERMTGDLPSLADGLSVRRAFYVSALRGDTCLCCLKIAGVLNIIDGSGMEARMLDLDKLCNDLSPRQLLA